MRKKSFFVSEKTYHGDLKGNKMVYLVTYDLKKKYNDDRSSDYEKLYEQLNLYYNQVKITESSWIISTAIPYNKLRDELRAILRDDDSLFVGELTKRAAWHNCIDSNNKILEILK